MSLYAADFVKFESRRAGIQACRVTIADVHDEIGLDMAIGKKQVVQLFRVKARHRTRIQPQRAGGEEQVTALQAGIAERVLPNGAVLAPEVRCRVLHVRRHSLEVLVECQVLADDHGHRRRFHLGLVARGHRAQEPGPGRLAADEHQAHRLHVHTGRPPTCQLVELLQEILWHRLRQPGGIGPGLVEQLVQGVFAERFLRGHVRPLVEVKEQELHAGITRDREPVDITDGCTVTGGEGVAVYCE